jgi:HTH-type transcriptional regulator/antitoxin HigA
MFVFKIHGAKNTCTAVKDCVDVLGLRRASFPLRQGSMWRPSTTIKPIRRDEGLRAVFRHLESICQANESTAEADERDVLVTLIEAHENKHYAFGPANPVEAIKFRLDQQGLTQCDLDPYIGPSGRDSEVLNCKRPLSLRMVKQLHEGLKISHESLLAGAP